MRLIFKMLGVVLLVLPLLATTTGAIYLEGQAPPDDGNVHILAASNGLADVSDGGLPAYMMPSGFGYPALSAFSMPDSFIPSAGFGSLPGYNTTDLPSLSAPGYWNSPCSQGFMAKMPAFKATRVFGQ